MRAAILAFCLGVGIAIYIRLRWKRSPQAYRAMMAVAFSSFISGGLLGAWIVSLTQPKPTRDVAAVSSSTGSQIFIPNLQYDPGRAILPDSKVTPGDSIPGATKEDVYSYGWAREHRDVSQGDRAKAFERYPNSRRTCACQLSNVGDCCDVDHLIPLELGGSNDDKNLWPQPWDPRPGSLEKDQLENELHSLVCKGTLSLKEAQQCIASNWIECWKKYMVPEYGSQWSVAYRHNW